MPIVSITSSDIRGALVPETTTADRPAQWLVQNLGRKQSDAGVKVSDVNTLSLSAIYDAIRIMSESEAQLPLKVIYSPDNQDSQAKTDHPAHRLIHSRANKYMSAFLLRKLLRFNAILHGNGYAIIDRDRALRATSLWYVESARVRPYVSEGAIRYAVAVGGEYADFPSDDVIHIVGHTLNGYTGIPLYVLAMQSLGHMVATETFGSKFFGNGAHLSGLIKYGKFLRDEKAVERVKSSFISKYAGIDKAMGVGLLEDGMDWQPLGVPPEAAQFLQTRQFHITEVARWINIPVSMIKEMARATFNNAEQLDIQFVKYSLGPNLIATEQELEEKLLTMVEKQTGKYRIKHNYKGLLRGDIKTQAMWYDTMFRTGAYSPNKILSHEDEPTYTGGDKHFVHSGATLIEKAGAIDEQI
jgi:HK97 family phage portal protein